MMKLKRLYVSFNWCTRHWPEVGFQAISNSATSETRSRVCVTKLCHQGCRNDHQVSLPLFLSLQFARATQIKSNSLDTQATQEWDKQQILAQLQILTSYILYITSCCCCCSVRIHTTRSLYSSKAFSTQTQPQQAATEAAAAAPRISRQAEQSGVLVGKEETEKYSGRILYLHIKSIK